MGAPLEPPLAETAGAAEPGVRVARHAAENREINPKTDARLME